MDRRDAVKAIGGLGICGSLSGCLTKVLAYKSANVNTKDSDTEYYMNRRDKNTVPEWKPLPDTVTVDSYPASIEITKYPNADPTEEHYSDAYELYSKTYDVIEKNGWFDIENAREDGYVMWDDVHTINEEYMFNNGKSINYERPESIVYHEYEGERYLSGVMYFVNDVMKRGEQVAGPLTVWHWHPYPIDLCISQEVAFRHPDKSLAATNCGDNEISNKRSPEMIHVWIANHPEGPFATRRRNLPDSFYGQENVDKMSQSEFRNYLETAYNSYYKSEQNL